MAVEEIENGLDPRTVHLRNYDRRTDREPVVDVSHRRCNRIPCDALGEARILLRLRRDEGVGSRNGDAASFAKKHVVATCQY